MNRYFPKYTALILCTLGYSAVVLSDDTNFPQSGTTVYQTFYTVHVAQSIGIGEFGKSNIEEYFGLTKNISGDPWFDGMSAHCIAHYNVKGDDFEVAGTCVEKDGDGDKIFLKFDAGGSNILGGTGKYEGISANVTKDFEFSPGINDGVPETFSVKHTIEWQLL